MIIDPAIDTPLITKYRWSSLYWAKQLLLLLSAFLL